jgi:ABC-type transport system involved in cytochrome bd biosynthesis fused ATPase/permease subunit
VIETDGIPFLPGSLNARIGWAGQRVALLPASLRANLLPTPDQPMRDDAILLDCLTRLGLGSMLERREGLDLMVDHRGSGLSGGERRRIGLARAVLSQRPILLLDEPTADLDAATAEAVRTMLGDMARERLVVAATHDDALIAMAASVCGGAMIAPCVTPWRASAVLSGSGCSARCWPPCRQWGCWPCRDGFWWGRPWPVWPDRLRFRASTICCPARAYAPPPSCAPARAMARGCWVTARRFRTGPGSHDAFARVAARALAGHDAGRSGMLANQLGKEVDALEDGVIRQVSRPGAWTGALAGLVAAMALGWRCGVILLIALILMRLAGRVMAARLLPDPLNRAATAHAALQADYADMAGPGADIAIYGLGPAMAAALTRPRWIMTARARIWPGRKA